jgi:para-nitrobenzyl esterase
MSEDCLSLNIWTPANHSGEKLPIMVWLYGGAWNEGGGNSPFSRGHHLAAKGVVVVTFNYGNGAFGFLSHPELTAESPHQASGNQGFAARTRRPARFLHGASGAGGSGLKACDHSY